jgi:quercetin dioxygenase-like cupin family protein
VIFCHAYTRKPRRHGYASRLRSCAPQLECTAASTEITRKLLQTTPLADLPGWEVRLFLISYPPGADVNNHSHPVVGVGFVLEGSKVSAFDDDPEETFVAGQSFVDPAPYHRIVRNGSNTKPMKLLIAYTVRTGEPNTVLPKK